MGKLRGTYKEYLINRIKKNIIINSEDCWIWQLNLNKDGYGLMKAYGKTMQAHVVSAIVFLNFVPNTITQINHIRECRNRSCINPEHIYIGTQSQNMHDRSVTTILG